MSGGGIVASFARVAAGRSARRRSHGGAFLALAGALVVSGCDRVVQWQRPELAACQRFVRSRMKLPTSFHRQNFIINDIPVDRAMLADAVGPGADKAAISRANWPVIRDVFIQYYGDNSFGEPVFAATRCQFAMLDGTKQIYARDPEASVDGAVAENEARTLELSLGKDDVVAADCCTARDFDPRRLSSITRLPRGKKPKAKKA